MNKLSSSGPGPGQVRVRKVRVRSVICFKFNRLVPINRQKIDMTHLSMTQSPEIQTERQTMVTRGLTSIWPSRKSAIRVAGSQSSGTRTLRTLLPRLSATCLAIWLRVTSNTRDNKLMDNEGHH